MPNSSGSQLDPSSPPFSPGAGSTFAVTFTARATLHGQYGPPSTATRTLVVLASCSPGEVRSALLLTGLLTVLDREGRKLFRQDSAFSEVRSAYAPDYA